MNAETKNLIENNSRQLKRSIENLETILKGTIVQKYFNVSQASKYTGLSKSTLRKDKEKIGYNEVRGMHFFKRDDLDRYMDLIRHEPMNNPFKK